MPIQATFTADFTKWDSALKNASEKLKSFEVSARTVGAQLNRAFSTFSGEKIIRDANLAVAAIQKLGGVSKLTATEQAKLNATVTEAIAKYKALGLSAPTELKKLQKETAGVNTAMSGIGSTLLKIGGLFAATFTVGALTRAAKSVVELGSELTDLSARTGIGIKALQEFGFAGGQVGVSLESITTAVGQMQKRIAGGEDSAVAAMKNLGISIAEIRKLQPEEQFALIAEKIKGIEDPAARAKLAMDLMGRGALEVMPLLVSNFEETRKKAEALGLILDEKTVAALDDMDDSMAALSLSGQAVIARMLVPMTGQLLKLASALQTVATWIDPLIKGLETAQGSFLGFLVLLAKGAAMMYQMQVAVLQFTKVTQPLANVFGALDKQIAEATTQQQYYKDLTGLLTQDLQKQIADGLKPQAAAVKASAVAFEPLDISTKKASKSTKDLAEALKKAKEEMADVRAELQRLNNVLTTDVALQKAVESMQAWETANIATSDSLDDVIAGLPKVSAETEGLALSAQIATDAYHEFGLKTPQELQKAADAARFAYQQIVAEVGKNAPAAIAAHEKMIEAINAASGKIPSYWKTNILPGVTDVIGHIQTALSGSFAAMLLGAKSFKDGFIDIWKSIKAGILNILASIAEAFLNSFLKGLLGMLSGQSGAFSKAFGGLFGGIGQGALGGLFGGGGAALAGGAAIPGGALINTGIAGGVSGTGGAAAGGIFAGTTGALLGGAAAGGGGLLLGLLGKKLFGGAGAAAGAFGAGTGAATGALIGSVVPVLGTAIGALVGGLAGLLSGLFGKKESQKVNDARDQMLTQMAAVFGGTGKSGTGAGTDFAILGEQLQKATGSGELFNKFLKASTLKDFEAVTKEVAAALDAYKTKTDAAAASQAKLAESAEQAKAKLAELKSQMTALDQEEAALNASEKPEAHMGNIEKAQRESIAKRRSILEAAVKDAEAAANKIADAQAKAAADAEIRVGKHIDNLSGQFVHLGDVAVAQAERARQALISIGRAGSYSGEAPEANIGYSERYARIRGYAEGGIVYAAQGWMPRGTDTVPAMLTPGEVVLPRDVVSALRSSSASITVNVTITALDGADVERVVRSPSFRQALTTAVAHNTGGYRTDLRSAIGVR